MPTSRPPVAVTIATNSSNAAAGMRRRRPILTDDRCPELIRSKTAVRPMFSSSAASSAVYKSFVMCSVLRSWLSACLQCVAGCASSLAGHGGAGVGEEGVAGGVPADADVGEGVDDECGVFVVVGGELDVDAFGAGVAAAVCGARVAQC